MPDIFGFGPCPGLAPDKGQSEEVGNFTLPVPGHFTPPSTIEGKVQIDLGDRRYGPLAALVLRRVMNVSRSGFISRED
ncbi:hypothetical protein K3M67_19590 (plasmid) [Sphingobium sp. V4]|uniref:hypothetical protein n=1 Tax=Sphingobium sp. V4 TaxID=3038927 RepID=UPI00255835FB|nr:hypothetical protein [Sphingobium sp. V4]WIW90253.1 hypothetical protein K3M67_19590 [Sphingobium sp. V4]